jgi:ATP phosphoribosyltransferase regulatory subunit
MTDSWAASVLAACHASDQVAVAELSRAQGLTPECANALRTLPTLNGGGEAIEACAALLEPLGCAQSLDGLRQAWRIVESLGATAHLRIDFSVMSTFDYYTDLIFEAYSPYNGLPLGGGGRYDHMLQAFGMEAPAAGFAFDLERVMRSLSAQGTLQAAAEQLGQTSEHVPFDASDPARAFKQAAELRQQGRRAVIQ